jgi:hypothetical protein
MGALHFLGITSDKAESAIETQLMIPPKDDEI